MILLVADCHATCPLITTNTQPETNVPGMRLIKTCTPTGSAMQEVVARAGVVINSLSSQTEDLRDIGGLVSSPSRVQPLTYKI